MNINFQCNIVSAREVDNNFGNIVSVYSANDTFFAKNGTPFTPVSGEIHYSRYDECDWRREVLKMRQSGINIIATYVFWNMHEVSEGIFDFEGNKNLRKFIGICAECEMPVMLRIGPWCHGEVVYGGFPKWIIGKPNRCNNKQYLEQVTRLYKAIYNEVAEYMDGNSIIGVQIENEFGGNIEHIHTLKQIAVDIGYKTAFFTMTAWPYNKPDKELLSTFGGYPEAPWTMHKRPLGLLGRFNIGHGRDQSEIGADLIKTTNDMDTMKFSNMPFSGCEVGTGMQVTQHRRPNIKDKDGYAVPFVKFASGMNWLGYYMYHGCRNNNDRLWQESRKTGYPNNYQIIDYDFQAPISRYGKLRAHVHRLRLLHTCIHNFDSDICTKKVFFSQQQPKGNDDLSMPRCSVRINEKGEGYFFASTFERLVKYQGFKDVQVSINSGEREINLPSIDILPDSLIMYPFNITIGGKTFDYITAQPITRLVIDGEVQYIFSEIAGISAKLKHGDEVVAIDREYSFTDGEQKVKIIVLPEREALAMYDIDGKRVDTNANVYSDGDNIYCEYTDDSYININGKSIELPPLSVDMTGIALREIRKVKLPLNRYLYSHRKRRYYELSVPCEVLDGDSDIELSFRFSGLNLQVFCGDEIINDCFNIDGVFEMNLRGYEKYFRSGERIVIKAVPSAKHGIARVYNEIGMKADESELELVAAREIRTMTIAL